MMESNLFICGAGLALGAWLGRCGVVTDSMIQACAEALPELIKPEALETGFVFPSLADARYFHSASTRDVEQNFP